MGSPVALIKKIIRKLNSLLNNQIFKLRILKIRALDNVSIPGSVKVYSGCQIKTAPFGGQIRIGENCELSYGVCLLTYGGQITIGDNCSINPYSVIYGHGKGISIGNNVLIAGHTLIIPTNHGIKELAIQINRQPMTSKGIVIEDNVWVGAGCKILDGVCIKKGAVVAAGSVVINDVPENAIVAGVPAEIKKIRK